MKYFKSAFLLVLLLAISAEASAQRKEMADGIVAIVGDEIIMYSEFQEIFNAHCMDLNLGANTPRSEILGLRDEVINGMVDDLLLIEKAKRDSLQIDMREIDTHLNDRMLAFRQDMGTEEAFQKSLENYGLTELQLRNMLRDMIIKEYLKSMVASRLMHHVSVTPREIEAWIEARKDSLPEVEASFRMSHILIYPRVSESKHAAAHEKLEELRKRALEGEDFAELAKKYSQDPGTAMHGGDVGYFRRQDFLSEFTTAAFALNMGEISNVVETAQGLHLIKVEDILGNEVKASHILIRLIPDETDGKEIMDKLRSIKEEIESGKAKFEDMARKYSEDENSNILGGRLVELPRSQINHSLAEQAVKLNVMEISEPFRSQFGYHIIRLDAHKPAHIMNIRDSRTQVEGIIRQQKIMDEYSRLINDLRKETYIEIRMD